MIVHEPDNNRFVLREEGALAQLLYRKVGNRLTLIHTEVPDALGGRGVGGQLVRAAVDWAREGDLTIVPLCPFARKWLTDHEAVAATVKIDWASSTH